MSVSRQNKTAIMNSLENTLVLVMKEKPFAEISIQELCERAGVGRSSFYRYYTSKEEVVTSLLLHMWYAWRKAEGSKDYSIISRESARSFIHHVFASKEFFISIYRNKLDSLFPIIIERNGKGERSDRHYKIAFFCYGVFGVLRDWWMGGCKESAEELIQVLDTVSPDIEEGLLSNAKLI